MPSRTPVRLAASVLARFLTTATVGDVVDHGTTFRTITLATPDRGGWTPGDKVRIAVRDLSLRTYTPLRVERGALTILAHLAGTGPGSAWCAQAEPGQECRILGPQKSVDLPKHTPAPLVVGDETSLGLYLAQSATPTAGEPPTGIFEVDDPDAATVALAHHNGSRPATFVTRRPGDGHLDEHATTVTERLAAQPDVRLLLTGRAQTIALLRRRLKDAGLAHRTAAVKAYWDVNRRGLD
jgi:NADPH-dependent ferric siderophore reductase